MTVSKLLDKSTLRAVLLALCAAVLILAFAVARPQPARADVVTPPPAPANLQPPAGSFAYLAGHAIGTQNYICLPTSNGFGWTFYGPQATLFDDANGQVITHFLSPNPGEGGTPRATWQHSRDTSAVWAAAIASSTDPNFVAPGAIPWLLLKALHTQDGPTGGDRLSATTYIQRLNTSGGVAPKAGCTGKSDVGKRTFVPYTADYYLYR